MNQAAGHIVLQTLNPRTLYFLLSEGFLWWPSLSLWKGRDQGTLPTEPFFRLLEFSKFGVLEKEIA